MHFQIDDYLNKKNLICMSLVRLQNKPFNKLLFCSTFFNCFNCCGYTNAYRHDFSRFLEILSYLQSWNYFWKNKMFFVSKYLKLNVLRLTSKSEHFCFVLKLFSLKLEHKSKVYNKTGSYFSMGMTPAFFINSRLFQILKMF